ncbi:Zn-ribbon domain-containing OB-fold protein [Mycobacterium vicinigordonae]|uniref:OB-fold domain-containing protein n=1 Tax=Mycobacterium vicinigordonae TaxID=1719132 RepID=A0A7D6E0D6_9MYCO|nr:OB-fold domain-containing protein [Mycobacterium vicinigordonae]QLL09124.1 OB-fold domain-containing protein [Mycobacterium vicinigordonae]
MTADLKYQRPLLRLAPTPTTESLAFWTGGGRGELLVHRCHACRHFFHPPAPVCWRCRSRNVAPEPISGRAKVAAHTVNRQPWIRGFEPPYVVAMVELDDEPDVRLITNIVDVDVDGVYIGMPVEVFFEEWPVSGASESRVWLPLFRPVGGGSS